MKKWLLGSVAVLALARAAALANEILNPENFAGNIRIDAVTGETSTGSITTAVGNVYENTLPPAAATAAFSSTNLNTVWGDTITTTGTGTLEEMSFTVFNSSTSNTLPITTYASQVLFRRTIDSSLIGGFTGNINFGTGLNPGFFSIVTFTNLSGLTTPINLDTTGLTVTTQRTAHTGGSTRMGIAFLNPINVGSSDPANFLVNGVVTTSTNANPGYRLNVIPEPASFALLSLGALALRRRS